MNKNIDMVPTYPKYPTNSFESNDYVKMLSNNLENTLETSPMNAPEKLAHRHVVESVDPTPHVSILSLSFIEYLGIIGICVFILFIVTEVQLGYDENKQNYLIKTNAKPPTLLEVFENMKTKLINNITKVFNNSIEYVKMKYQELNYSYNKWKVNSHLENKTLKTIDISYYKDKYK